MNEQIELRERGSGGEAEGKELRWVREARRRVLHSISDSNQIIFINTSLEQNKLTFNNDGKGGNYFEIFTRLIVLAITVKLIYFLERMEKAYSCRKTYSKKTTTSRIQ